MFGYNMIEFIEPSLVILIPVCWTIKQTLKKIPNLSQWMISITTILFSSFMAVFIRGLMIEFSLLVILSSLLQGIVCAGIALYGDAIIKLVCKKK